MDIVEIQDVESTPSVRQHQVDNLNVRRQIDENQNGAEYIANIIGTPRAQRQTEGDPADETGRIEPGQKRRPPSRSTSPQV